MKAIIPTPPDPEHPIVSPHEGDATFPPSRRYQPGERVEVGTMDGLDLILLLALLPLHWTLFLLVVAQWFVRRNPVLLDGLLRPAGVDIYRVAQSPRAREWLPGLNERIDPAAGGWLEGWDVAATAPSLPANTHSDTGRARHQGRCNAPCRAYDGVSGRRTRMRPSSITTSTPVSVSPARCPNAALIAAFTTDVGSVSGMRDTMMPACVPGGNSPILAKPLSAVMSVAPVAWAYANTAVSLAPRNPTSRTSSTVCPACRSRAASERDRSSSISTTAMAG